MKKTAAILLLAFALALTGCSSDDSNAPSVSGTTDTPAGESGLPSSTPSEPAQAGSTIQADAAQLTLDDYFPLNKNVHMTYAGQGNEYAGMEVWVDYAKSGSVQLRKNNSGTEWIEVYVIEDGALKRVFTQEEVYYRQDFTAMREESEIVLMEPLQAGTSWELGNGARRSITALSAAVTVPYGTYTALEVTTVYDDSTTKDYYAPGIGLVKREVRSVEEMEPITSELENFEEGSPLRQHSHFFYPDFNNGRVAYIEKELDLKTNEDIIGIFEREFKTVPEGSNLTPLMPKDATLNSVYYDTATRVVTADVSSKFITGMNAGAFLEGLILQSVADTLGWYFQTDKVQLTVDGGPYESGHYLFNLGDYLPVDIDGAVHHGA